MKQFQRYDEAIECFDKVISLKPYDVDSYTHKVKSLVSLKRHPEAIECLQRALEMNPKHPLLHNHLAIIFELVGKLREAINHFKYVKLLKDFKKLLHKNEIDWIKRSIRGIPDLEILVEQLKNNA